MIRILHTADLHLGVESYGRLDPATGLSSRIGDCLAVLDQAVQAALDQEVDLFLFCGDAYKNREPSPTLQREFARRVGRLASNGVAVFLLVGNHDLPNALGRATAVEIFDTLSINNIHVASRPGAYRVETRRGPLQVVALPWVTPSRILSKDEYKGLTLNEINRLVEDKLNSILRDEISSLDPRVPAVLAAHVLVSGAKPSSEARMTLMQSRDALLMPSQVADPAFAYVALGHIHRHQVLNAFPPVVYSGSLQRLDFGEEKEEKGYMLVEIVPGQDGRQAFDASFRFIPVESRRFLTIDVNAEVEGDPTAAVLRELEKHSLDGAIVRLSIKITAAGEGLLRDVEIRRALHEAHFVAINRDVKREQRLRLGGRAAEELGPLEALELYLATKGASQERIRVLQEYAGRLMGEGTPTG